MSLLTERVDTPFGKTRIGAGIISRPTFQSVHCERGFLPALKFLPQYRGRPVGYAPAVLIKKIAGALNPAAVLNDDRTYRAAENSHGGGSGFNPLNDGGLICVKTAFKKKLPLVNYNTMRAVGSATVRTFKRAA